MFSEKKMADQNHLNPEISGLEGRNVSIGVNNRKVLLFFIGNYINILPKPET